MRSVRARLVAAERARDQWEKECRSANRAACTAMDERDALATEVGELRDYRARAEAARLGASNARLLLAAVDTQPQPDGRERTEFVEGMAGLAPGWRAEIFAKPARTAESLGVAVPPEPAARDFHADLATPQWERIEETKRQRRSGRVYRTGPRRPVRSRRDEKP